jgi:hypothetical protein
MKKRIQLLCSLFALAFTIAESNGQVINGTLSSDWTLTDINGVSHNLYTYLDSGKTVFIDISATWCSPCWSYHNSGAFENLWINHGPVGGTNVSATTTNDCMVIFVEGDGTTSNANLHGYNGSLGDWTAGVSHPIIDPSSPAVDAFDALYNVTYFPTCVMICPDRTMTEVDLYTTAQLYAAKSACSIATTLNDAEMIPAPTLNTALISCDSVTPTFIIGNVGTNPLTSATITYDVDGITQKVKNWTGNIPTYANESITGVKIGSSSSGNHTITATISNPNGSTDPSSSNNATNATLINNSTGGSPISESFENMGIPGTWTIADGGAQVSWSSYALGLNSNFSAVLQWAHIPSGYISTMTLTPMSFIGAISPTLTFDVAYAQRTVTSTLVTHDKLEVQVSTNCGATWVSVYNKAGATLKTVPPVDSVMDYEPSSSSDWRHETVNLSIYAGLSSIFVRFKGTSNFGNDLYIDNINFNISSTTGIEEHESVNNLNVYPNPVTGNAIVNFNITEASEVAITLYNTIGETILNDNLGKLNPGIQNYSLNSKSINNGLYFLNIRIGNSNVVKKITINNRTY